MCRKNTTITIFTLFRPSRFVTTSIMDIDDTTVDILPSYACDFTVLFAL